MLLDTEVIIDTLSFRINVFLALEDINTNSNLVLSVGSNKLNYGILNIETGVEGQSLGDNQQGFSKGIETELFLSINSVLLFLEGAVGSNFESTSTGDDGFIIIYILHGSETISNGILSNFLEYCEENFVFYLDGGNSVVVGALDEDSAGSGVLDTFNESVFFFTEGVFRDFISPALKTKLASFFK